MKKIGILLPQSKSFPRLGKEFLNGLKLADLEESEFEYKIEGIGLANDPNAIIDSIQKLVNQEDVDLITGLLGHRGLNDIHDFVEGMDETLIYSDLGSTLPVDLSSRSNIWCNSLDLCQSAYDLVGYLTKSGMNNIGTSSCYYDCGYGFLEAMQKGLSQTESAGFSGHFITPLHPRENEAELMQEFAEQCSPEAIIACYSGLFAKEHASFLQENKINKSTPLYSLLPTVYNAVADEYTEVLDGSYCMSSWYEELSTKENVEFREKYEAEFGNSPSFFSLLGYENGLLIKNYLDNNKTFKNGVVGPRGEINMDPVKKRTIYPNYLCQLNSVEGKLNFEILEVINTDDRFWVMDESENKEHGGWHNSYLCHG